jgi:hypothetical protein
MMRLLFSMVSKVERNPPTDVPARNAAAPGKQAQNANRNIFLRIAGFAKKRLRGCQGQATVFL